MTAGATGPAPQASADVPQRYPDVWRHHVAARSRRWIKRGESAADCRGRAILQHALRGALANQQPFTRALDHNGQAPACKVKGHLIDLGVVLYLRLAERENCRIKRAADN